MAKGIKRVIRQGLSNYSLSHLTSLAFRNPRGANFIGTSRDQLLQVLSNYSLSHLTSLAFRNPRGANFIGTSRD